MEISKFASGKSTTKPYEENPDPDDCSPWHRRRIGPAATAQRQHRRNHEGHDPRGEGHAPGGLRLGLHGGRPHRFRRGPRVRRRRHHPGHPAPRHPADRPLRRSCRPPHQSHPSRNGQDLLLHRIPGRHIPGIDLEYAAGGGTHHRDGRGGEGIRCRRPAGPRHEPAPQPPLRPQLRVFLRGSALDRQDGRRLHPRHPVQRRGRLREALRRQQPGNQPHGQ